MGDLELSFRCRGQDLTDGETLRCTANTSVCLWRATVEVKGGTTTHLVSALAKNLVAIFEERKCQLLLASVWSYVKRAAFPRL